MLVRVSTIGTDEAGAYALQDRFVNEMLGALDGKGRARLMGAATNHG
jgi:hypothetical protein